MSSPLVNFNAGTGSDAAASGAGPGDGTTSGAAVSGSAAAHTGGVASNTITLTNGPTLTAVATDGSAALWLKTASGRQFSKITAVNTGTGQVTVEDSFTIAAASAVDYAIGGKRATWDAATSRTVFADAKAGWTIQTETDQTLTSTITLSATGSSAGGAQSNGAGTAGRVAVQGASVSPRPVINMTANAAHFSYSGSWLWMQCLQFTNSNATKTSAYAILHNNGASDYFYRCIFGDATNKLLKWRHNPGFSTQWQMDSCEVKYCTQSTWAIEIESSIFNCIRNCYIHHNTGSGVGTVSNTTIVITASILAYNGANGVQITGFSGPSLYYCTIHGNASSGVQLRSTTNAPGTVAYFLGCNITGNGGWGIANGSGNNDACRTDCCNFFSNTSGTLQNGVQSVLDIAVDPGYTDPTNGNFTPTKGVLGKGYPGAGSVAIGGGASSSISYADTGAVQAQPSGGGLVVGQRVAQPSVILW